MAIVNPLQQRLMMERMRRDPRLAALMAARGEGGLAELAGLPQGAMNLAELAGMAPPAQVVTPAQPAPVQPGAEVRAPTETVGGEEVAKEEAPDEEPIKTPPPLPNTPLGRAQQEAIRQDIEARAARYVDSKEALLFAGQTKRYDEELAGLEQDRKRAGWEALAMAGFKMAQSQSPYFMSALASGMEAGLTGYNANKMARAERKARLQAAGEQVVLNQIAAERAAEQRERDRQRYIQEYTARALGLGTAGKKAEFEEYIDPFRRQIEGPLAVAQTLADIADRRASAEYRSAAAANVGADGDGGDAAGGPRFTRSSAAQIALGAQTTMKDAEEAMASALETGDRTAFRRAATNHTAALSDYNKAARFLGLNPRQSPRYRMPKSWVNGGGGRQAHDPLGIR